MHCERLNLLACDKKTVSHINIHLVSIYGCRMLVWDWLKIKYSAHFLFIFGQQWSSMTKRNIMFQASATQTKPRLWTSPLILIESIVFFRTLLSLSVCVYLFSSHRAHTDVHSSRGHTDTSLSLCHKCRYFDSYISAGSWHQICPQDILRDRWIK